MTCHHLAHPKYRPDIDGLRAVAVLAVVVFHAFPEWLKGGFIGVDIFFVISGYLISTIIFENLDKGTFSFSEFYARRIKRIFPALIIVLIACFAIGWFTLLADEFKQLGKHMAAGAGFISNIMLWQEAGYFDNSAETKPLLHLWSLGIEEQFYIIWPLLLWFAWKRNFNLLTLIILVAATSFVLNLRGIKHDAIATFYSPQTRFWELSSGGILAWLGLYKKEAFTPITLWIDSYAASMVYRQKPQANGRTLVNLLSFAGLLLLAIGFCKIHKEFGFPGKWALVPVSGAVLIILAGSQAWVNRVILSNKIAVWFGLISFPFYLWHWPLLTFARIIEGELPSRPIRMAIVAISIALAWGTYRLVEKPVRFGPYSKSKICLLVALMTILGFMGYNTYERDGFISRYDMLAPYDKEQMKMIANAWRYWGYPTPKDFYTETKYGFVKLGHNNDSVILIVGDSHAQQYWNTINKLYNMSGKQENAKPSVMFTNDMNFDTNFPPRIDPKIVADPAIRTVIFSYYWSLRYGSETVNQAARCCGTGKNDTIGHNDHPLHSSDQMDALDNDFMSTVKALKSAGKDVYFILDNPFGEENDPHSMLVRTWSGLAIKPVIKLKRETALMRTEPVRARLIKIAKATNSTIIDPFATLCDEEYCPAFSSEGELIYKDYDHLSLYASLNKVSYLNFLFK